MKHTKILTEGLLLLRKQNQKKCCLRDFTFRNDAHTIAHVLVQTNKVVKILKQNFFCLVENQNE